MSARNLLALVATLNAAACGDSDASKDDFQVLSCEAQQFRLVGSVDGRAVEISEPTSGGFVQGNSAVFDQNRAFGGIDPNPEATKVHLEWSGALAHGQSGPVSGIVVLPPNQPRTGQTLCASGDSRVGFSDDGRFGFHLVSLTGGTNCAEAVQGNLKGCWRSRAD